MKIFLSTGEPSGDLHAANLIAAIRDQEPKAEFVGFGGPRMHAEGAQLLYPLVDLAVMWIVRVLLNLHVFVKLVLQADRYFRDERPDVVVLIDYPGFNFWIARMAKRRGIPTVFFVPPQIWAWRSGRVKKVRRDLDLVLCSMEFEEGWYHERNVPQAEFIGHPYFDEISERRLDEQFIADFDKGTRPVVALLPGSRTQEVERNYPLMVATAARVAAKIPEARFVVAALHEKHRSLCAELNKQLDQKVTSQIELYAGKTPELIKLGDVSCAVSGSVGLELMAEALPTVVVYRAGALHLWLAHRLANVPYMGIVNLLAGREIMPEFATSEDRSSIAEQLVQWLNDSSSRVTVSEELATLRDRVATPGATARAATRILKLIESGDRFRNRLLRVDEPRKALIGRNRERGRTSQEV